MEQADCFHCPGGQRLVLKYEGKDGNRVIRQRLLFVVVAPIMLAAVNPGREQDGRSPRTVMKVYAAA